MSAFIYNIDETYDLELQIFKFGEYYGDVRFFSVLEPRIEGSGFTTQVAKDAARDIFEGYAALWGAESPTAFIVRVGKSRPDVGWLDSLAEVFPQSACVIVVDHPEESQWGSDNYLTVCHSDEFLSSDPEASRFFALMAIHDFVTSGAVTNLGSGQVRIRGVPKSSVYGYSLSLGINRETYSKSGNTVTSLPTEDRITRMADLKKAVLSWVSAENTAWQSRVSQLREHAENLSDKAESFRSKQGSRLGAFTEIAETDQTDLLASGNVQAELLKVVLASRKQLCEIATPPLLVSGFSAGKPDCPNSYQQTLRDIRMQFMPGLQAFLGAAERLVANISRERRQRLRAHEKEEILALHSELSLGDRCDPEQLDTMIDELRKSASEVQGQIAEIESEQDNEYLFSTEDVDVSAINRDYLSSFRAAARLASSYWLMAALLGIFGLISIPVIERLNHNSESFFPYDMLYLGALEFVIAACFLFVAWRIRTKVRESSSLYAATLREQFLRKDVAVCQFVRYLYLSTALRRINLMLNALEIALANQNQRILCAQAINSLVSHIVPIDQPGYSTQVVSPIEWVRQLKNTSRLMPEAHFGKCQLTVKGEDTETTIVEYPCRLLTPTQTSIIIGTLENAVPD